MSKKFIFGFLSIFIFCLLLTTSCGTKKKAVRERSIRVKVQKPLKQNFQERLPVKGTIYPVESATISAKTEGTLDDLKVSEGDFMKKGDVLFSIDRLTLENDVIVKREEVAVAKTELSTVEIELKILKAKAEKKVSDHKRAEQLIRKNVISTTDYEGIVVDWKEANALVEKGEVAVKYRKAKLVQAEMNYKIACKNLKDSIVTAPFDCLIAEKLQEQGEYVKKGSNILKLENISKLEIIAYLSARYHHRIKEGKTPVIISVDGQKFGESVIYYRAKTIDPLTRTFKIKAYLPQKVNLSSGMLCSIDIILGESSGWGVPDVSVLQTGEKFHVFTVSADQTAKRVQVTPGITDKGSTELLNPGSLLNEQIVVSGQRFLSEGIKLTIAE